MDRAKLRRKYLRFFGAAIDRAFDGEVVTVVFAEDIVLNLTVDEDGCLIWRKYGTAGHKDSTGDHIPG